MVASNSRPAKSVIGFFWHKVQLTSKSTWALPSRSIVKVRLDVYRLYTSPRFSVVDLFTFKEQKYLYFWLNTTEKLLTVLMFTTPMKVDKFRIYSEKHTSKLRGHVWTTDTSSVQSKLRQWVSNSYIPFTISRMTCRWEDVHLLVCTKLVCVIHRGDVFHYAVQVKWCIN